MAMAVAVVAVAVVMAMVARLKKPISGGGDIELLAMIAKEQAF